MEQRASAVVKRWKERREGRRTACQVDCARQSRRSEWTETQLKLAKEKKKKQQRIKNLDASATAAANAALFCCSCCGCGMVAAFAVRALQASGGATTCACWARCAANSSAAI